MVLIGMNFHNFVIDHLGPLRIKISMFKPAVEKRMLIALSGITWSVVGIVLCRLAVTWLSEMGPSIIIPFGLAGLTLSFLIYYFGFSKIVDRNTERILSKDGKVCVFAFQAWKSYLIVAVMIGMGIALRSSPLPKNYLSVIYIGFGGAMIISSVRYYRVWLKFAGKQAVS